MDLKETIQKYLPELPELVSILKQKFSSEQTFISDNGDLLYSGELAIGIEAFVQHGMEECIMKKKEAGMSKEDAMAECKKSGKFEKIPAPTKTYKHSDGTEIVIESGKIVDIKKPKQETPATDFKAFAEEIFKAFPKTDLSAIEIALGELKTTLAEIQKEKTDLKAKVDKFEQFKTEVITILEKFSASASAPTISSKKTDSSKSIFNTELSFEERVKILNETK